MSRSSSASCAGRWRFSFPCSKRCPRRTLPLTKCSKSCRSTRSQKAAIRACKAALAGDIDAETARGILVRFARKKDILVEDGTMTPVKTTGRPLHV
ncbi:DUF982 domain-containing protein [Mesorhizobium abyssinicae]|uniref:DUF982 domain-containing protein n=1 Tax=Mesorhizobium abyssinicae TaxID=1209958 RepID=UPI002A241654|nr:DUF982 domain-containing protein [Mesorhizobium abyssinicae]MDX8437698.1 DUF982 domain-containing protein [Mesorhizobium abyssinicae]